MTSLASLNSRDEHVVTELFWYFNDSQDDLCLKSNYPQMVAQMQLGAGRYKSPPISFDVDERLVNIATRVRIISRRLQSIGDHAYVLKAWLSPPPKGIQDFGELAGVVVLTARNVGFVGTDPVVAARMLIDLCRDRPALKQQLLFDAERIRRAACRAYAAKRKGNQS
jgi:hypothetical protein